MIVTFIKNFFNKNVETKEEEIIDLEKGKLELYDPKEYYQNKINHLKKD
jgi:hypothetical protein